MSFTLRNPQIHCQGPSLTFFTSMGILFSSFGTEGAWIKTLNKECSVRIRRDNINLKWEGITEKMCSKIKEQTVFHLKLLEFTYKRVKEYFMCTESDCSGKSWFHWSQTVCKRLLILQHGVWDIDQTCKWLAFEFLFCPNLSKITES